MIFTKTNLEGAFVIELEKREDERGFFSRAFCANEFKEHGLKTVFVQSNISRTLKQNTLRGMHYQVDGAEEAKLVRCTKGSILDVIIDVRKGSSTFGKYFSVELSEHNHKQIYVPEGFAHGFMTLEDNIEVTYMVSQFYAPGKEKGIRWNDPFFDIDWGVSNPFMTDRDANYEDFQM